MRLPLPAKSDTQNALHEAGHAVAGYTMGIPIEQVSLIPEEQGEVGYVRFSPDYNPQDASKRVEIFIVNFGGYAAEKKAGYEDLSGWQHNDGGNLERCIPELIRRGVVREGNEIAFRRWLMREACAVMDENWATVQKFAEVLKEERQMTGRETERLCEKLGAKRRTDSTLLYRWLAEQGRREKADPPCSP